MIIAYLLSRLGNQMFQYACARALSLRLETDLVLNLEFYQNPDRPYQLDHFKIVPPPSVDSIKNNAADISVFREPKFYQFYPNVLSLPDNTMLVGYWQSEDYFVDQAEQIRREFVLKDPISDASRVWAQKILDDPMPVSLHVRRGDYLTGWGSQNFYQVSLSYYEHCVKILLENFPEMSLYIFSDDLPWCREAFKIDLPIYFVDANDEDHGWEDMFLMSLCRHHIITNSSFSWWGAWLDDRVGSLVFAPSKFYKNYSPAIDFKRYPSCWIVLDD